VFVAEEGPSKVAVFDLRRALATRFASSGYVGSVPLAQGVVGMALSPDGRTLYATSEEGQNSSFHYENDPQQLRWSYGTLSVIDVAKAESQPRHAVLSITAAGCDARRVTVSPDGKTVWTTAAGSDQLLAFSSQKLVHDPKHALLAAIRIGAQPFGLATFDDGRRIVVCDVSSANNPTHSSGSKNPGSISGLTIVNAQAALDGNPSLIGDIPAGVFPRNLTVEANGTTLLATNFWSGQLEAVDLHQLGK
jgi:DNA-binding beta-propeller fold protein YncE